MDSTETIKVGGHRFERTIHFQEQVRPAPNGELGDLMDLRVLGYSFKIDGQVVDSDTWVARFNDARVEMERNRA